MVAKRPAIIVRCIVAYTARGFAAGDYLARFFGDGLGCGLVIGSGDSIKPVVVFIDGHV